MHVVALFQNPTQTKDKFTGFQVKNHSAVYLLKTHVPSMNANIEQTYISTLRLVNPTAHRVLALFPHLPPPSLKRHFSC